VPNFLINFHRVDDASDMDAYIGVLQISSGIDSRLQQAIEAATIVVLPKMQSG
jgi:hypothetical protein